MNFLNNFEKSLKRLETINDIVNKNLQNKKDFSQMILNKLIGINNQIKGLAENINKLNTKVVELQKYVDQNADACKEKTDEITELTKKYESLQKEKAEVLTEFNALKTKCQDDMKAKQIEIDNLEEKLRKITEEKNLLDNELKILKEKGDSDDRITKQAEQFQAQLSKIEEENNRKIAELTNTIEEKDKQINELNEKLLNATKEASEHKSLLDQQSSETAQNIQQLKDQIAKLEEENKNLINRIIYATDAINAAVDNLNKLSEVSDTKEIDNVFESIEESINNISNAMNLGTINQPIQNTQNTARNDITKYKFNILGKRVTLGELSDYLMNYQGITDETYDIFADILDNYYNTYIDKSLTQTQIDYIETQLTNSLSEKGINLDGLTGGKKRKHRNKTRKIKKKGGYTYTNMKRRSISHSR